MMTNVTISKSQNGAALFVGLVLLLVMTLVAITAMQSTTMEVRMAKNDSLKLNAFETSEGPRPLAGDILDQHIFERGWGDQVSVPVDMTVLDNDGGDPPVYAACTPSIEDPTAAGYCPTLYDVNGVDEEFVYTNSMINDMSYTFASGGGSTNLKIFKVATKLAAGTSAAMVSGYEGTGKAAAASGANIFFDIRSDAQFGDARAVTDTDYRIVIRN